MTKGVSLSRPNTLHRRPLEIEQLALCLDRDQHNWMRRLVWPDAPPSASDRWSAATRPHDSTGAIHPQWVVSHARNS
jgi:hypothetical protein